MFFTFWQAHKSPMERTRAKHSTSLDDFSFTFFLPSPPRRLTPDEEEKLLIEGI
jgi:hypothetical protein